MKILILTTADNTIGPMAKGYLLSFDHKLEVSSAGLEPASEISRAAIDSMNEVNINIGYYSPQDVTSVLNENWEYVITFCTHVKENFPAFGGKVLNRYHLNCDSLLCATDETELAADQFRSIRGELYQLLRKLYRERLIEETSCSCGANYFCRCE